MDTELTIQVSGISYPVSVDYNGMFSTTIADQTVKAPSLAELERTARKTKVKFELPFSQATDSGIVTDGTVTGVHASSGNLLVRWANGISAQLSRYGSGVTTMKRLSADEAAEYTRLQSELDAARKAARAFTEEHSFPSGGIYEAVRQAQKQALKKEES